MYDLVTRVPLIVWSPKRFAAGQKIEVLCQQMDLGPTILELAGAEVPQTADFMTMVRTKAWKLVQFLDEPYGQLFDLINDPQEIDNRWLDATAADMKHERLSLPTFT